MEEYTKLVTEISGKMWKVFKPRITGDMTKDDYWTDAHREIVAVADEYEGTVAEGYAIDMAIFYFLQLQRICFKDDKRGRISDWKDLMLKLSKEMRKEGFDFTGFMDRYKERP